MESINGAGHLVIEITAIQLVSVFQNAIATHHIPEDIPPFPFPRLDLFPLLGESPQNEVGKKFKGNISPKVVNCISIHNKIYFKV